MSSAYQTRVRHAAPTALAAFATFAIPALAQQPPDVVQSNDHQNTAMALSASTTGANNIAIGYFAGDLLTGSQNIDRPTATPAPTASRRSRGKI